MGSEPKTRGSHAYPSNEGRAEVVDEYQPP